MSVNLVALQPNFIQVTARQLILKPIVYLIIGVVSAIFLGLLIGYGSKKIINKFLDVFYIGYMTNRGGTYRLNLGESRSRQLRSGETAYSYICDLATALRTHGIGIRVSVFQGLTYHAPGSNRQYFNILFQSLKQRVSSGGTSDFIIQPQKNLLIPQAAQVNNPRSTIYYDIGTIMAHIFSSETHPVIGAMFSDAIFAAIQCLSDDEINRPFEQLTDETKLKLCETLFRVQTEEGEHFELETAVVDLLAKGEALTEQDLLENERVKGFYVYSALDVPEGTPRDRFLGKEGDEDHLGDVRFNTEAILQDVNGFRHQCLNFLLQRRTESLGTIGRVLFPIHTMAKGMREHYSSNWSHIKTPQIETTGSSTAAPADHRLLNAQSLRMRIQGTLDRQEIIGKIKYHDTRNDPVVADQVQWIKDWIVHPDTSNERVEKLLTFWTGSSHVYGDIGIHKAANQGLWPTTFTCSFALQVTDRRIPAETENGPSNTSFEGYCQVLNKIADDYSTLFTGVD